MIHFGKFPIVSNCYPTVSPHQAQHLLTSLARVGEAYRTGDVRLSEALTIGRDAELRAIFNELARFAQAAQHLQNERISHDNRF
jgi:hypothetical protein